MVHISYSYKFNILLVKRSVPCVEVREVQCNAGRVHRRLEVKRKTDRKGIKYRRNCSIDRLLYSHTWPGLTQSSRRRGTAGPHILSPSGLTMVLV